MPFGQYPFGQFPFGHRPPAAPSAEPINFTPDAVKLDPETGAHFIDENGNFEEQHPVDHEVQMLMFPEAGSMKSTPLIGNTLGRVKHIASGDKHRVTVEGRVNFDLKPMVDAKKIEILGIRVQVPVGNRTMTEVSYMNLITSRKQKAFLPE